MRCDDLRGKVALVTGTAGGIGGATADALLDHDCTVFGLDREEPDDLGRDQFRSYQCSLESPEEIKAAFGWIGSQTDSLDFLVNIAGIDPKWGLAEGGFEEWEQVFQVNLRAYYLIVREALPLIRRGAGKSIVNISSINYRLGIPKRSIYSASKAGVLGLTTGLARELGSEGIRINSISPGWVFTEGQIRAYFQGEEREKNLAYLRERQAIDLKISPTDIASHVLFYLSEASRASTGHNCVVDAGWLLE